MDEKTPSEASRARRLMLGLMRIMGKMMPTGEDGENPSAVRMFRLVMKIREFFSFRWLAVSVRRLGGQSPWPQIPGDYIVGERKGPVAICVLSSDQLMEPLSKLPGVALAGSVRVPNLGIEKIILNVIANPSIRFLLLCGQDSKAFQPGQALQCLQTNGVDEKNRIIGATGHLPRLSNLQETEIEAFCRQIKIEDRIGETDPSVIESLVGTLVRQSSDSPKDFADSKGPILGTGATASIGFVRLKPGGKREPVDYDQKGFFVVSVDREKRVLVLQHFYSDHSPAHEIRARSAGAIMRAVVREELVSQLSHAGYLGGELAKAEAALQLDLNYTQDRPLKLQQI